MSETLLNKNQAGSGIWTSANNPISGAGAPDANTPAIAVGQHYFDTVAKEEYYCASLTGSVEQNFSIVGTGTTIDSNYIASGFVSYSSYILTPYKITTSGSWKIKLKVTHTEPVSGAGEQSIVTSSNFYSYYAGVKIGVYQEKPFLAVSPDGNSWPVDLSATTSFTQNVPLWLDEGYEADTQTYYIDVSSDGEHYNREVSYVSSVIIRDTVNLTLGAGPNQNAFKGTIDLAETYFYEDGNVTYTPYIFNGTTWKKVGQDLTQASGYDANKTQVLKNVNGVLTWVDQA